jgi:hypothetical protein
MATYCKGFSARHLVRVFKHGSKNAFGLLKNFHEFHTPFQSLHGHMAAIVSLLEARAKDAATGKKDFKEENLQPLLDPLPPCRDWARNLWLIRRSR